MVLRATKRGRQDEQNVVGWLKGVCRDVGLCGGFGKGRRRFDMSASCVCPVVTGAN